MSSNILTSINKAWPSMFLSTMLITSIAALSQVAAIPPVLAQPAFDPKGDSSDPNFDIKTFGLKDGNKIFVQLYGKAARTLPADDHIGFAYVFDTDNGVWAINGHREPHSTNLPEWHAERILVDGNCTSSHSRQAAQQLRKEGERAMGISLENYKVGRGFEPL